MDAGENGNNSRASRKQAGPLLKTSSVDPQSVYGTAAGCNRKMNNPARVVAMNGGEIKAEVGEAPAMGCYVRLTLVAISVLYRPLNYVLREPSDQFVAAGFACCQL